MGPSNTKPKEPSYDITSEDLEQALRAHAEICNMAINNVNREPNMPRPSTSRELFGPNTQSTTRIQEIGISAAEMHRILNSNPGTLEDNVPTSSASSVSSVAKSQNKKKNANQTSLGDHNDMQTPSRSSVSFGIGASTSSNRKKSDTTMPVPCTSKNLHHIPISVEDVRRMVNDIHRMSPDNSNDTPKRRISGIAGTDASATKMAKYINHYDHKTLPNTSTPTPCTSKAAVDIVPLLAESQNMNRTSENNNDMPTPNISITSVKINPLAVTLQKNINTNETLKETVIPSTSRELDIIDQSLIESEKTTQNDIENTELSITPENIQDLYKKNLSEFKETIARDANTICITFDYWNASLKMGQNFIAITAHYINKDFEVKHVLLECKALVPLDSMSLSLDLARVANEWDITTKVTHVVAKYSSNMEKTLRRTQLPNMKHYSWCFYESLNQIVTNALIPMASLFENINIIVNNINRDVKTLKYFCEHQILAGNEKPKLLLRERRWCPKHFVLLRFIMLKDAVNACIRVHNFPAINDEDWTIADQLNTVLASFQEVMLWTSEQYIPSIPASVVIVLTNNLRAICDDYLENPDYNDFKEPIKKVIASIKTELMNLFAVESTEFVKSLGLCTFLDPRFKTYGFYTENAVSVIKNFVCDLITDIMANNNSEHTEAWRNFDKLVNRARAQHELQMYLEEDLMPRKLNGQWTDPAQWWKEHKDTFPNLAEIYRTKCSIVGVSVQTERLITEAGKLLEDYHLKATLEQLAFLTVNLVRKV